MNRGIYGAASGMMASQDWLDVVSNNLANVNTTGFKRDGLQFQELMERNLYANGGKGEDLGTMGTGPTAKLQFTFWQPGAVTPTGNPLDVAITTPEGLFAVRAGDQVRFTRAGNFGRDPEGFLVTKEGGKVLDDQLQPINLGTEGIPSVDALGNISVEGTDGTTQDVGRLGLFTGTFKKVGDSLFASENARPMTEQETNLQGNALEQSNVNAVQMMVDMITISRSFEMTQKAITTQDEQTGKLIESLRGS